MDRAASAALAGDEVEGILEGLGDGVYVLDPDGQCVYVNDALVELVGYDRESLLGRSPEVVVADDDFARFDSAVRTLVETDPGGTETVEASVETARGATVPVEVGLTVLRNDEGAFAGTVGVVRDVRERRSRERELEQYERRFDAVFEDPHLLVGLLEPDGTLLDTNATSMRFVDADRADVVGEPFHETPWWTDDVAEEVRTWVDRAADGEYVEFECDLERPDGEPYTVEGVVRPVTDDGEVVSLIVSAQDVTERRERKRELERYETLLDLLPDTVVITDLEGGISDIHGADSWSGYPVEELRGSHFSKTVTGDTLEAARDVIRELLAADGRGKATYEHVSVTRDGEVIPFENHVTLLPPDEDGHVTGTMSVLRNISERKERERELRRQNERLEEFADVVSHDLRNPLNVAQGTGELLREDYDDERLDRLATAHDRMAAIIDDVLALAREGASVEETETVDVGSLASAAWDGVQTPGASLVVEAGGAVEADAVRLTRLLENLFRNAVEHGSTRPRSHARENAVERDDPSVTVRVGTLDDGFYVADDGPGVPAADREKVFESGFTDGDGTGLGLAIVDRIAEAHGWSVDLTESDAGGARFEITGVRTQ